MRSVVEKFRGKSVRVFALDGDAVRARLAERARALQAADPQVLEVRLFGSLARDDARPGSDADLLIVLRESRLPFLERAVSLARHFAGVGVGCDVLAYTEAELRGMREEGNAFVRAADRDGITLTRTPA